MSIDPKKVAQKLEAVLADFDGHYRSAVIDISGNSKVIRRLLNRFLKRVGNRRVHVRISFERPLDESRNS